ncbi:MAG: amidohydrolase family protein [Chloroflexota bacterium]|nr:amidohydrolase family protein [Chloroflexota bacterium]
MDLSAIPIFDHHAHPLLKPEATQEPGTFRRWFSESTHPLVHDRHVPHSLFFRTALRWLAERLGCEPTLESVLAARAAQPYEAWVRALFDEANIEVVLCDYGYGATQAYDHGAMQALLPCRIKPILRLESLAERLIRQHVTFDELEDRYAAAVCNARVDGYVALKSIIAYRSGLAVAPVRRDEAAAAFDALRGLVEHEGRVRLDRKPLCDYLLLLALDQAAEQGLPVQFHTGFGDSDADLRLATPLHLRWLIERYEHVPLILLHAGWPFYRELAHLAAIYPNVWMDLSLAIPFATVGIPAMLREVLGMAPFSKLLFATDAFTMPEIYWLAVRWGRWGLGQVLTAMVEDRFLSASEAETVATAILWENARTLYALPV